MSIAEDFDSSTVLRTEVRGARSFLCIYSFFGV